MADANSIVNPQITDAVTQDNVKVLCDGPALAMGNLFQATDQALGEAALNSGPAQQGASATMQATTTSGVTLLYGVDTAATAVSIAKILGSGN